MTSAVVVARAGSKRLPRKALLPFAGATLVAHKVRELRRCLSIDRVYVGSDSDEILAEAEAHGGIPVLRDSYHCDEDRCTANEMIADMAGKVSGDLIVWAHPTNPLVKPSTYDNAIATYHHAIASGYDSLVSVTEIRRHAWINGQPFNYDPYARSHAPASSLLPVQFQDGAIFIQARERFVETRYFFGRRPYLFTVSAIEGWDIDDRHDYLGACRLWDGEFETSVCGTDERF